MNPFLSYLLAAGISVALVAYVFLTARRFDNRLRWILGGGLFARWIYLLSMKPHDQANDWGEHIYYIKFIADRGVLPKWYECYECTHPPMYHAMGASFLQPIRDLGVDEAFGLQCFTFLLFAGVLTALLSFLRNVISRPEVLRWAGMLLAFWPRSIALGVTINNDVGAYLFSALALDFLTRQKWALSGLWAGVGLLCKTSGVVVYPVLALWRVLWDRRVVWKSAFWGVLAAGLLVLVAYTFHNREGRVTSDNAIIGNNVGIGQELMLGREIGNFVCFGLSDFVTYPDIAYDNDSQGRQCLWNFLLKTSLITEHYVKEPLHADWARWLSVLLLVLVGLAVVGAWAVFRRDRSVFWLWVALIGCYGAGMCVIRYQLPMSATGDFRYIYPVAAPFAGLVASSLGVFSRRRWMGWAARGVMGAFVVLSIAYYLVPLRR